MASREVDLTPTWHATHRYVEGPTWTRDFMHYCGYDLSGWSGFPAQISGPLRRVPHSPPHVLRQRVGGLVHATPDIWIAGSDLSPRGHSHFDGSRRAGWRSLLSSQWRLAGFWSASGHSSVVSSQQQDMGSIVADETGDTRDELGVGDPEDPPLGGTAQSPPDPGKQACHFDSLSSDRRFGTEVRADDLREVVELACFDTVEPGRLSQRG